MILNMHHDHGRTRRVLIRGAVSAALALTPTTVLVAPALAAPVVLEPADQIETSTDQTETVDSYGDPIHRGGRGNGWGRGWRSGSAGGSF